MKLLNTERRTKAKKRLEDHRAANPKKVKDKKKRSWFIVWW